MCIMSIGQERELNSLLPDSVCGKIILLWPQENDFVLEDEKEEWYS